MTPDRGTALVTGAGRGIGAAIARDLLAAGFKVAMASIEQTSAAAAELQDGKRCIYYRFDVAGIDGHAALLDQVERELGAITCLVNNAGVTSLVRGDMLELSPESFDRCVAVNLRGTFFLTQAVAKRWIAAGAGKSYRSVITISSVNAELIGDSRADYCITKSALTMLSKLFAVRLSEAQVGVFEVRPGVIKTDMTAPATERYNAFIAAGGVPMGRWGTPDDIAQGVVTLASGGLPFATGMHVDIGGGMQMYRLKG
jgi:NAD(P)-dependent dehydrogenase (short-subunit alcohol dehydrogenase family)